MSSDETIDKVIAQVVTNVNNIECALESTVLYVHLFNSHGKFKNAVCNEGVFQRESNSASIDVTAHPLIEKHLQVVGSMNLHIGAIETENLDSNVAVLSIVRREFDSPFELTYEVNILTRTYGEVKKIANFEFQSTNEGATEILALISPSSCVAHETDSFELGSGWNFLYLGKILPFLESFELLPKIQEEVLRFLNNEPPKPTLPQFLRNQCFFKDPKNISSTPRPKIAMTELRQYDQDLTNAIKLLKGTSKEMKAMANRVYATPWKPSDSSSSNEATTRLDDTEKVKRQLREELLEVLENYKTKESDATSEKCINRLYQQVELLKRDLHRMQQKQIEMEYLLASLTSHYRKQLPKQRQSEESDEVESQPSADDVLIRSFHSFATGFELLSQGLGSSFRLLQRSLYYPSAFKDLSPSASQYSRQLLKFVTSKKATDLVADIETLAGLWRVAGTRIEADFLFKPALM